MLPASVLQTLRGAMCRLIVIVHMVLPLIVNYPYIIAFYQDNSNVPRPFLINPPSAKGLAQRLDLMQGEEPRKSNSAIGHRLFIKCPEFTPACWPAGHLLYV